MPPFLTGVIQTAHFYFIFDLRLTKKGQKNNKKMTQRGSITERGTVQLGQRNARALVLVFARGMVE